MSECFGGSQDLDVIVPTNKNMESKIVHGEHVDKTVDALGGLPYYPVRIHIMCQKSAIVPLPPTLN